VKAFNLQFIILDEELLNELIKDIVAFSHELGSLFLCHMTRAIHFWGLKIRKHQDENSF
jgi:hypothetical protein